MPEETVYITEIEGAILAVFVARSLVDNGDVIKTLEDLIVKLKK